MDAVRTPLGYMYGRDAIYVDKLDYELERRTVTLTGEFNGALGSDAKSDDFIMYTLRLEGVYYFNVVELDLYGDDVQSVQSQSAYPSNWLEYRHSTLLDNARQQGKAELQRLRHFILFTYDDVFEIVCRMYTLELHALGAQ